MWQVGTRWCDTHDGVTGRHTIPSSQPRSFELVGPVRFQSGGHFVQRNAFSLLSSLGEITCFDLIFSVSGMDLITWDNG